MIALLHLVDLIWVGFHPCFLNIKCIIARLRSSMHSYYFTFFALLCDFLFKSRFYALLVSIWLCQTRSVQQIVMDESWFSQQTGKFRGFFRVSGGRPETILSVTFPYFTTDLPSLLMQCGLVPILPFELVHHIKGHSQQLKLTTREIYLQTPSPPLSSHLPLNQPLLEGIFIPYPAYPTVLHRSNHFRWNLNVEQSGETAEFGLSVRVSFVWLLFNFVLLFCVNIYLNVLDWNWSWNQSHQWRIISFPHLRRPQRELCQGFTSLRSFSLCSLINGLWLLEFFPPAVWLSTFQMGHSSLKMTGHCKLLTE